MLKTINKQVKICDFCLTENKEVEAVGTTKPSGKDVCSQHYNAFLEEVRLPKEMQDEMSGYKEAIDPGFRAKMVIKYVEE